MYPNVAVLLTTFNGGKLLYEQIASLKSQNSVSLSIFISDDLSTDNTLEIIKSYEQESNLIQILENNKKFSSPAHNFFSILDRVNLEEFDFILYSDQDDVWLPNKIIHSVQEIVANNVDCYASNLYIWKDSNRPIKILEKSQRQTQFDYLFQSASAGCTYCISKNAAIALKKTLSENLCQSPKTISHDWITYAVTRSYGFKWVIDSTPQIMYRQHNNNFYGSNSGLQGFFNKTALVKKGWYKENLQYVSSICQVNEENQKFIIAINRLSLLDKIFLLRYFHLLRRKFFDGILLGFSILFGVI
jgi:rhamnosyltransferase